MRTLRWHPPISTDQPWPGGARYLPFRADRCTHIHTPPHPPVAAPGFTALCGLSPRRPDHAIRHLWAACKRSRAFGRRLLHTGSRSARSTARLWPEPSAAQGRLDCLSGGSAVRENLKLHTGRIGLRGGVWSSVRCTVHCAVPVGRHTRVTETHGLLDRPV